jgi:hypothetical protein
VVPQALVVVDIAKEPAIPSSGLSCDGTCNPLVKPLSEPPEPLIAIPELESAKQEVVSVNDLVHRVAKFK